MRELFGPNLNILIQASGVCFCSPSNLPLHLLPNKLQRQHISLLNIASRAILLKALLFFVEILLGGHMLPLFFKLVVVKILSFAKINCLSCFSSDFSFDSLSLSSRMVIVAPLTWVSPQFQPSELAPFLTLTHLPRAQLRLIFRYTC